MRRTAAGLLVVLLTACAGAPAADLPRAAPAASGWSALPEGPLSARHSALALALGDELLLLGGRDTPLCPPTASCVPPERPALRDAAAYDVGAQRWRELAPLPVPASSYEAQAALLGDAVHVLVTQGADAGAHLRYDVRGDAWERLPTPPLSDVMVVAAGDLLVAYQATQEGDRVLRDLVYDPRARTWEVLPPDPLLPSFDRAMTWTGKSLVLTGPAATASPGGESGPSYVRAAVLDPATRTWTRLPDSEQVISYGIDRAWDGERVVSPYVRSSDGGTSNGYGRSLPAGGLLDPGTGRWEPLPGAPEPGDGRYVALSRRWVTAGEGLVLDTALDRWTPLPDHDPAVDEGQGTVWVGDRLVVWGGGSARVDNGGIDSGLVASGAVWEPLG